MGDSKSTVTLNESLTNRVLGAIEGKNKWRVRLIAPGRGSSGHYTEEVLRTDGPKAWPKGTLSHVDHQTLWEREERPAKSLKTVAGVVASDPVYEDAGPEGPGLYADMEFTQEWAPFIEQLHEHIGVSISSKGVLSESEEVDGVPLVEMLLPYPTNSVDLVTAAGAGGKFSHLLEQFHAIMDEDETNKRKEPGMTPEEIEKIGKALAEALVPSLKEALAPAPPVEDENEDDTPKAAEVAEAIVGAGLPEIARKRVYVAVESGLDLIEAIKEQKDFIAAIKAEADTLTEGVLHDGSAKTDTEDFKVGGWN